MRTASREVRPERHQRRIRPKPQEGQAGAPPVYDPVRFPFIAKTLCTEYGFTSEQLGKVFGVSTKTVNSWVQKHEDFRNAYRSGKDEYDGKHVENALLRRALGYGFTETTTTAVYVNAKDAEGHDVKIPARRVVKTVKEIPPDVKACIFWLTNRNPDRWKMVTNVNANVKGSIEHNHSGTVTTANLENLNTEQLLALRDIVAMQQGMNPEQIGQQAQIEYSPEELQNMNSILAECTRVGVAEGEAFYESDDE